MEIYKVCFTLVARTLTVFSSVANGDEFARAYTKIEKVNPTSITEQEFLQTNSGRRRGKTCLSHQRPTRCCFFGL